MIYLDYNKHYEMAKVRIGICDASTHGDTGVTVIAQVSISEFAYVIKDWLKQCTPAEGPAISKVNELIEIIDKVREELYHAN